MLFYFSIRQGLSVFDFEFPANRVTRNTVAELAAGMAATLPLTCSDAMKPSQHVES
jgi:hypothetical protein